MTHYYSEQDLFFITENYPIYGPKYCATILGRSEASIFMKAKRMGLSKEGVRKHPLMQKINPEQFWNITSPEVAYFLGLFWADGNIIYRKNKTSNMYKIALEIISTDAENIDPLLDKLGKWSKTTRKRNENWKRTTTISTNSKDIYEFLEKNDYLLKSNADVEPTRILSKIPNHLKHYWWRGYFDGDGHISKRGDTVSFIGSSSFIEGLQDFLKNELGVDARRRSHNSVSRLLITHQRNISKLKLFLYEDADFFLQRKYDRFRQ